MPSVCRFVLNKPSATYKGGETISGKVILTTTSAKNVREMNIIFLGESKVKWDELFSRNSKTYRGHELHIENKTLVHGDGVLAAGTHTYSFNITLPTACPTSIEAKYGHTRYEIILKLSRLLRFDNVFKQQITVLQTVDLNLNSSYKLPLLSEGRSSESFLCSSGPVICTLQLPFTAYAPRQLVKYTLTINNQSNSDIRGHCYEFKKKITYTATEFSSKKRCKREVLDSNNINEECLPGSYRHFGGSFTIPTTPPTSNSRSILCVEYYLKVTVNISGCRSNCVLKVPIIIGTIAIRESK